MKVNILYIMLAAASFFLIEQSPAQASVNKVGNTWILSPAAWYPHTDTTPENHPFDINKNSTGNNDFPHRLSTDK
ncbi:MULTISPECIES: hypothetical protein [Dickeya]|uniref:hypothetical protein n=1 Tax=Dickeya TaxID=204037 RepID=UPI0003A4EEBD|nr:MULTISPECIES: hypothetical protein [Dickeya]MBO8133108.1 hypothetical protein [Dickeya fangzhongdai]UGA51708.1 hypothetical protein QR68_03425 [Dickeya fangzhongdai]ULR31860.1 hypothetical protein MJO48_03925 [Dickeya fangzhongdai]UMB77569.1 hypothetical protein FXN80_03895 [Dickeya fangzhongdai]UWH08056.1 hypothetical protein K0H75_03425 [Dickeya fangzhongdai]